MILYFNAVLAFNIKSAPVLSFKETTYLEVISGIRNFVTIREELKKTISVRVRPPMLNSERCMLFDMKTLAAYISALILLT